MILLAGGGRANVAGVQLAWAAAETRSDRRFRARTLLRELLSVGTRLAFTQVCSRCGGEHGQVRVLIDGRPGPLVSVSYTGQLAVVAVAPPGATALGIDAEIESDATRRAVREAIGADDLRAWLRWEAAAKARGTGLRELPATETSNSPALTFHEFAVELDTGERALVSVAIG